MSQKNMDAKAYLKNKRLYYKNNPTKASIFSKFNPTRYTGPGNALSGVPAKGKLDEASELHDYRYGDIGPWAYLSAPDADNEWIQNVADDTSLSARVGTGIFQYKNYLASSMQGLKRVLTHPYEQSLSKSARVDNTVMALGMPNVMTSNSDWVSPVFLPTKKFLIPKEYKKFASKKYIREKVLSSNENECAYDELYSAVFLASDLKGTIDNEYVYNDYNEATAAYVNRTRNFNIAPGAALSRGRRKYFYRQRIVHYIKNVSLTTVYISVGKLVAKQDTSDSIGTNLVSIGDSITATAVMSPALSVNLSYDIVLGSWLSNKNPDYKIENGQGRTLKPGQGCKVYEVTTWFGDPNGVSRDETYYKGGATTYVRLQGDYATDATNTAAGVTDAVIGVVSYFDLDLFYKEEAENVKYVSMSHSGLGTTLTTVNVDGEAVKQ